MSRCPTTRGDSTGLRCTLDADHANGCVFIASSAPDGHTASEQAAEEGRS